MQAGLFDRGCCWPGADGGFGSFLVKAYGTAAASLLEAEVVTADGTLRTANACTNADLFWALKGGGGGSLGAITRLTLRTHALPLFLGATFLKHRGSVGRGLPTADCARCQLLRRDIVQSELG